MPAQTALIVDDSSTARVLLNRVLESLGIQAYQANCGEQALSILESEQPDIIFLDHMMPGMDGFQTLRHLKANPVTARIPVFMYTSQNAVKYKEEAKALGAAGIINKQIKREELSLMVEQIAATKEPASTQMRYDNWSASAKDSTEYPESALRPALNGPPKKQASKVLYGRKNQLEDEVRRLKRELLELRNELNQEQRTQQFRNQSKLYLVIFLITLLAGVTFFKLDHQQVQIQSLKDQLEQSLDALNELIEIQRVQ